MKKNLREKEQPQPQQPSLQSKGRPGQNSNFISQLKTGIQNTPQSKQAAQLQTGADQYTTQLKQERETSKVVGDDTAQLKPLSNSKLNVVGEDHNESNERRQEERQFTTDKTGGTYWEENEFQVTMANGDQTDADPLTYRLIHTLQNIARLTKHLNKFGTEEGAIDLAKNIHGKVEGLITLAETQWGRLEGVPYTGDLTPDEVATRDKLFKERMSKLALCKTALVALKDGQQLETKVIKAHVENIKGYNDHMANVMSVGEVTVLRSQAMHDAAQGAANTSGVWKIGEDHVSDITDILAKTQGTADYNLLTQSEFNDELKK